MLPAAKEIFIWSIRSVSKRGQLRYCLQQTLVHGPEVQGYTSLMRKRILASPPPQCWLLTHFARPRRVRMVFGAKGERVRVSAASPLVLVVMRRRAAELQICDAGAEPGGTRCSMRASEPCAMCDSWQIMSMWNTRCAQSEHGRAM